VAARIRLARRGTTKRPYYHIVVAHKSKARDGAFVERIGLYDPLLAENKTTLDKERAQHWLRVGARPTDRVVKILKLNGVEVPAHLMDKQALTPGKQKAVAARKAAKQQADEAKAQAEAARAKAKPAAGEAGAPVQS
jgi:small subunit ribosomal protein S16